MCPTDSRGPDPGPGEDQADGGRRPTAPGSEGPAKAPPGSRRERASRLRADLEGAVSEKAARKIKARREGDRGIWFGLGMMGLVGWSVTVPTVVGIVAGIWLDSRDVDPGDMSWTLTGLVVGVVVGCVNAWFWIQRELEGGG
ncbi:MAG: AtpZ/AtpI family protein [Longimicrobiales bacterium]|nr:AtpZ/AtpI family protein [Longimicrobiales bacterium]